MSLLETSVITRFNQSKTEGKGSFVVKYSILSCVERSIGPVKVFLPEVKVFCVVCALQVGPMVEDKGGEERTLHHSSQKAEQRDDD